MEFQIKYNDGKIEPIRLFKLTVYDTYNEDAIIVDLYGTLKRLEEVIDLFRDGKINEIDEYLLKDPQKNTKYTYFINYISYLREEELLVSTSVYRSGSFELKKLIFDNYIEVSYE